MVWKVCALTEALKSVIESSFSSVTVEGEISNMRPAASGHLYFTLKDEKAQLRAVMFRGNAAYLQFTPRDGMKVQTDGALSVYSARGEYQIIVRRMVQSGNGGILQMLEERKRRLAAEGLFDAGRKRRIPLLPKTVGVVTSPTGAAVRDILQIIKRRNPKVNIVILPAAVQGDAAPAEIVKQIRCANAFEMCDTLIVGRGGGSVEDLLPFSDEAVVRAVASSNIPVISAVGHEIDWALSDYAADYRAPTPSAAAEKAVPLLTDITSSLRQKERALYEAARYTVSKARLLVKSFSEEGMELRLRTIEQPLTVRMDAALSQLKSAMAGLLQRARQRTAMAERALEDANPQVILQRGYSVVRLKRTGAVLRNAALAEKGDVIDVTLMQGRLEAAVE